MSETCPRCGGALAAGAESPPCLCDLGALEESVPAQEGGTKNEARALRCPSCGGWLERGSRRCGYCRVELASVRCWRCFELAFAGSSCCDRCGASLGLEGDLGATEHRCPSCRADVLHVVEVGANRIRECPGCGGVLVDHDTLERLTRAREADGGVRALGARRTELKVEPVVYRPCPLCETIMTRRNFGRRSGVIVDVCKEHGVWFDPDELTAVLEFVASGGLAETRQRERDELEEELSRRRLDAVREQIRSRGVYEEPCAHSGGALLSALVDLLV